MAQALLLKTDVIVTSNSNQNQVRNQAQEADESKVQSFSSALDKQIDKQSSLPHSNTKKVDDSEAKSVRSDDNSEEKLAKADDKSGKILPEKITESIDESESFDEGQSTVIGEILLNAPPTKEVDAEIVSEGLSDLDKEDVQKQEAVFDIQHHGMTSLSSDAAKNAKPLEGATNAEPSSNTKSAISSNLSKDTSTDFNNENDELLVQKQQVVTSLRSDILNALVKKPTTESDKSPSAIDQKLTSSSTLLPIAKEGLTEEQKIMALANAAKSKGASFLNTGSTPERAAGVSSFTTPLSSVTTTSTAAVSAASVSGQPTLDIQPALQSEAWSRVLSGRVIWMAREGVQQASLKLNPANMGPVEVKLHVHNEQANISFVAQHAATRDALEQALPRLRDSFQENGMELAHADVSHENFSQAEDQNDNATDNGAISVEKNNNDIDAGTQDEQILEQDVALGLSVFA